MWNNVFNRLPENYSGQGQENNKKLHKVVYSEIGTLKKLFSDMKSSYDIDAAANNMLDGIGKNVLEHRRPGMTDDEYRFMIKTKIIANLSQGDISTFNRVAEAVLGSSYVGVKETWQLSSAGNEPAGLVAEIKPKFGYLPFNAIERVVAGGVNLSWLMEYKQARSEIPIATAMISGEEATVYPYNISEIESKATAYISLGGNTGKESVTIYPAKR